MIVTAESCAWCDIPRRSHGTRWCMGLGMHTWIAPSREQIANRIRARLKAMGRLK